MGSARGRRPCRVIAPDNAPRAKLDRVEELGGELILVPHEEWWQHDPRGRREGIDGLFVHPVADETVMAGNGTIGLELDEDAAGVRHVVTPWAAAA